MANSKALATAKIANLEETIKVAVTAAIEAAVTAAISFKNSIETDVAPAPSNEVDGNAPVVEKKPTRNIKIGGENVEVAAKGTETEVKPAAMPKLQTFGGVGETANHYLRLGFTNEEVLAAVRAQYPNSRTTAASISWYRSQLRNAGEPVMTAKELREARAAGAQR